MSDEQIVTLLLGLVMFTVVAAGAAAWIMAEFEERAWRRRWEQTKRRMERDGE